MVGELQKTLQKVEVSLCKQRESSAFFVVTIGLWIAPAMAQVTVVQENQVEHMDRMPIYRVNVVARSTKAINYRHRSGSTKVDFQGTALMPRAAGDAKVEANRATSKSMRTSRIWSRPASTDRSI